MRKILLILMCVLLLSGCGKCEKMDVSGNFKFGFDGYVIDNLSIKVNDEHFRNAEACKREIIRRYENNEFKSMCFPEKVNEIRVTVYKHRKILFKFEEVL